MKEKSNFRIGIYAPNLVGICVDQWIGGEMSGRIFHCYDQEPWVFADVVQLLQLMEQFFDAIAFPQAATASRSFGAVEKKEVKKLEKVCDLDEVTAQTGKLATFFAHVQYRQNATWQGTLVWVEKECRQNFNSTLEFVKLLDNAISSN